MLDRLQRPLSDLRISVTDRCNLRCRYCMPREVFGPDFQFLPRAEVLSFEEIARVARVLAGLGVRKIRLTGGEPLLRRDIERLIEMLASIEGVDDLALTTNGLLLARRARQLREAGLGRVTVSLDALDDATLRQMADAPITAAQVLGGIDAALAEGLGPVKVNMVVRRGCNDGAVVAMAERFRHTGVTLRFIEFMDVGSTNGWRMEEVLGAEAMREEIGRRWPLVAIPAERPGEVASRYRYADGAGEVGFIHSVTAPFCGACSRARLSADGRLYTCLFAAEGTDLRPLLRGDAGDRDLNDRLAAIWGRRTDRYSAERGEQKPDPDGPPRVEMSYIGG